MTTLKKKIECLNRHAILSYRKFSRIRFLTTIFLFVYLLFIIKKDYFYAPFIAILYYNLFRVVLVDLPLNIYISHYEAKAIRFFELVKLSLNKGNNIEKALELTAKYFNCELSYTYIKALIEVKFGKSLKEAVAAMKIPSPIIKQALISLTEKDLKSEDRLEIMDNVINNLKDNIDIEMKRRIRKVFLQMLLILLVIFIPLMLLIIYAKDIVMIFN